MLYSTSHKQVSRLVCHFSLLQSIILALPVCLKEVVINIYKMPHQIW